MITSTCVHIYLSSLYVVLIDVLKNDPFGIALIIVFSNENVNTLFIEFSSVQNNKAPMLLYYRISSDLMKHAWLRTDYNKPNTIILFLL